MKTKTNPLDKMDYPQFVQYLKSRNIEYGLKEDVDIDYWHTVYTIVTPINTKLKPRYFDNDGGHQLNTN